MINLDALMPPVEPIPVLEYMTPNSNGTYSVAVVGNGPLFETDRELIEQYPNVLRFNDMKNWREGERVTLHACRAEKEQKKWHVAARQSRPYNATMWALADETRWVPADAELISWSYKTSLVGLSLDTLFDEYWHEQVLAPWGDSVRLFPNCSACGHHCLYNQAGIGPSAGGMAINAFERLPEVVEVAVFGMNWEGGTGHTDFLWQEMVKTCCTKCIFHPTPSGAYLPPRFAALRKAKEKAKLVGTLIVGGASTAGVAWLAFGTLFLHHLWHRRNSKRELDAAKQGHNNEAAKQKPQAVASAWTARVDAPLIQFKL